MASELRVNSSTNRSGLGTITYTDSGPIVSGVGTFANGLTVDGTQTTVKSLKLTGDNYNVNWFKTSSVFRLNDNAKLNIGSADDMQQYHDGTTSYIKNTTGVLRIENTVSNIGLYASHSSGDIIMRAGGATSSENAIVAVSHGEVTLAFNGSTKLTTTNTGAVVTGILTTGNLYADNYYANSFLTINNNGNPSVNITSTSTTGSSRIFFGDPDSALVGRINYSHDGDYMQFYTAYGERLRITSNGNVGIATNNPQDLLHIQGSSNTTLRFTGNQIKFYRDSGSSFIDQYGTGDISFRTTSSNTERLRITSAGNALFGGTAVSQTNRQLALGSNAEANFAIETHNNAFSESSNIRFYKSRGTAASPTAVADNHYISQLIFYGHDGTDYANTVGYMRVLVDGTVASNQVPGQIQLGVNDGSSATTAMTIHKSGSVLFTGLTDKNDPRNAEGIAIKSPNGISIQNFGANGSHNWRIRPDDMVGWGTLEFSVSPTSNSSTDWPDAATDVALTLQSNKDVKVNNGNLVIGTAGKGIDFSATSQASGMSNELLDDYEEGSWTPTASGFTISTTYSARYTKIGRLVHINCYLQAATGNGTSQQPHVGGLPFTSVGGNTYNYGAGRIGTGSYNNSQVDIVFQQQSSSTNIKLYVGGGGINEAMMSGGHVIFSMVYEAA